MAEEYYDIWVEFNDIDGDGRVETYADFPEVAAELEIGQEMLAGDNEGNRCPATVISVHGTRIVLRLDLERFQSAGG